MLKYVLRHANTTLGCVLKTSTPGRLFDKTIIDFSRACYYFGNRVF